FATSRWNVSELAPGVNGITTVIGRLDSSSAPALRVASDIAATDAATMSSVFGMCPGMARSVSSTSPSVKWNGTACGTATPHRVTGDRRRGCGDGLVAFYNDTIFCYAGEDRARGVSRPAIAGEIGMNRWIWTLASCVAATAAGWATLHPFTGLAQT